MLFLMLLKMGEEKIRTPKMTLTSAAGHGQHRDFKIGIALMYLFYGSANQPGLPACQKQLP